MAGAALLQTFNKGMGDKKEDPERVIRDLTNQVDTPVGDGNDEVNVKQKEENIMELGRLLSAARKPEELEQLIERVRPFLAILGKAKAAKVVRALVDYYLDLDSDDAEFQKSKVDICLKSIEWAKEQNRMFLRQSLQARLVRLYNEIGKHDEALNLGEKLAKELKRMDDKDLIVEVQLEESKAAFNLRNMTKASGALTSARTTANGIYVPPKMQAALDMQSGIIHAADGKDFKTAFSYFFEAFEGYDSTNHPDALRALKYMLLSKTLLNQPDDVQNLLSGKLALKYQNSHVEAMKDIANAAKKRSLADFTKTFGHYKVELQGDMVVKSHFDSLYDSMLESNLVKIIQPYTRVEVAHIAATIGLERSVVEKKLSQMILDKKIHGILDQGLGHLIVFEEPVVDKTYEAGLSLIAELGKVVDLLHVRAKNLK